MIIFDLDDTLIDTTGSITPFQLEKALHAMVRAGLHVGAFDKALATLKRIDRASESASQALKEFLELVDGDHSFLEIGERVVYEDAPADLQVFPLEYAEEVLEQLKENHALALVSKGKYDYQLLKMKNAGLDFTIFSKIVISENNDKKASYREVLEELNMTPRQTIVCGDRIKRDLTPAKKIGCTTVQMLWGRGLVGSHESSDVDFKIDHLSQLHEIIEGL